MEETYAYCIHCKDSDSNMIGSFLYTTRNAFRAISPVFPSVAELFVWMTEHGFAKWPGEPFRVYRPID